MKSKHTTSQEQYYAKKLARMQWWKELRQFVAAMIGIILAVAVFMFIVGSLIVYSIRIHEAIENIEKHLKEPHIMTNNVYFTNIVEKDVPADKPITAYDLRNWIITNSDIHTYRFTNNHYIDDGIFLKEQLN